MCVLPTHRSICIISCCFPFVLSTYIHPLIASLHMQSLTRRSIVSYIHPRVTGRGGVRLGRPAVGRQVFRGQVRGVLRRTGMCRDDKGNNGMGAADAPCLPTDNTHFTAMKNIVITCPTCLFTGRVYVLYLREYTHSWL